MEIAKEIISRFNNKGSFFVISNRGVWGEGREQLVPKTKSRKVRWACCRKNAFRFSGEANSQLRNSRRALALKGNARDEKQRM